MNNMEELKQQVAKRVENTCTDSHSQPHNNETVIYFRNLKKKFFFNFNFRKYFQWQVQISSETLNHITSNAIEKRGKTILFLKKKKIFPVFPIFFFSKRNSSCVFFLLLISEIRK